MEGVIKDLNHVKFISMLGDSCNHTGLKLVPVLLRFYLPEKKYE
jgi:hypothetical protein